MLISFHYKEAIEAAENGASCLRINPGNIGSKEDKEVIKTAKDNNCSMSQVNAGSLEGYIGKFKEPCPEALVSAQRNIKILEDENFFNLKLVLNHRMFFYL